MSTGKIKIELFDAVSGELVKEINDHNFIAKGVQHAYRERMRSLFTQSRLANGHNILTHSDPFEILLLTDATHAEDPENEWMYKGNVIGKASSNSDGYWDGPDKRFGIYNIEESETRGDYIKMVFDFPTDRAIGNIGSVYFSEDQKPIYMENIGDYVRHLKADKIELDENGETWQMLEGRVIKRDANNAFEANVNSGGQISDFTLFGDYIYYTPNNDHLFRLPKVEYSTAVPEKVTLAGNTGYVKGLTKLGDRIVTSINYETMIAWDVNEEGLINPETLSATEGYDPLINIDGSIFNSARLVYSEGWNEQHKSHELLSYGAYFVGEAGDGLMYVRSTDINEIYKIPKAYIGSRALLDQPITKTAEQTMKITYEFILPPLYQ